jgi:hypothetical protein
MCAALFGNNKASLASSVSFVLQRNKDAKVMIKATLALAATIVLGSTVIAAAQSYYDSYDAVSPHSTGSPPLYSENPAVTGGGSIGYNDTIRKDDW